MYTEYNTLDLPALTNDVLALWHTENLFAKTLAQRKDAAPYVFFEGPPSANGHPGIHHVLARTLKDTICRYKTMQGFLVHRKAGWDTHGLPVELGVEKLLGITKEDIGVKVSVDEYNTACRREVMKYTSEWTALTDQMGYWIDLEHPYITYENNYIETVWYLLKELYKKGYLYKGYTIQPYSPAAGTGLSSHELNQPGCYKDVKDTTCVAKFRCKGSLPANPKNGFTKGEPLQVGFAKGEPLQGNPNSPVYALAWTTTPWTLPSNTALCVNPQMTYVTVQGEGCQYLLAENCLERYSKELGEHPEVVNHYQGAALLGLTYEPLFDWMTPDGKAFEVITGDYVSSDEGTGIVHIAPTFGADDASVAKKAGIVPLLVRTRKGEQRPMVDMTGKYFLLEDLAPDFVKQHVRPSYTPWQGRYVKNAYDPQATPDTETLDVAICMDLKKRGMVFRIEKHVHSYPHCWRTDKPILYYPLDSWFIKASVARERMSELNNTIHWQPASTGTGRFGKWLENLNDWNLSRSRYWGTPLPIWRTKDGSEEKCIGSVWELNTEIDKALSAGVMKARPTLKDLHRPYIDAVVLVSEKGQPMYREPDLIDVWFDSGAMPYAQQHWPFEGQKDTPPIADFVCEGVDQTRGWFYTLHAIHTMVSDTVAFKNVISNGLVLDKDGNKMSKRLGNSIDPFEMLQKYGADAVRWYMVTNSVPWENIKFDPAGVEEVQHKFFGTLYNTYNFFALYANIDHWKPSETPKALQEIDRWILSKLNTLVNTCADTLDHYDITRAGRAIETFVQNDLSNWYVRLNRKRYWGNAMDTDKDTAFDTLYRCLTTTAQLMAPIAPFYADRLYRDLCGTSVHLTTYPHPTESDAPLERSMALAQDITSLILALRKRAQKNVRQPLLKAVVPTTDATMYEDLQHHKGLIERETNIKELELLSSNDAAQVLIKTIKPNFKVLGKKVGSQMKAVTQTITSLTQEQITSLEHTGSLQLDTLTLTLEDVVITTQDMPGWLVETDDTLTVALDVQLTPALVEEGIARELVNRLQNLRKTKDFTVTDRIKVALCVPDDIVRAVEHYKEYISGQVLVTDISFCKNLPTGDSIDLNGTNILVTLEKVITH